MFTFRQLAALLLPLSLCGCQLVGALVAKAQGPPQKDADYVPKDVPTLILAEHGPASRADDVSAEDIGRRTADFWKDQKKFPPLIDLTKLEEYRQDHPTTYYQMSTAAIGRALGAKQVLYIDVRDAHDENAGNADTIKAKVSVRVKMVDVDTGQTLYPPDAAEGRALSTETQFEARGNGVSESTQLEEARGVIADKIVKLFYKHVPDTIDADF